MEMRNKKEQTKKKTIVLHPWCWWACEVWSYKMLTKMEREESLYTDDESLNSKNDSGE